MTHIKSCAIIFNRFKDVLNRLIINKISQVFPMSPVLLATTFWGCIAQDTRVIAYRGSG